MAKAKTTDTVASAEQDPVFDPSADVPNDPRATIPADTVILPPDGSDQAPKTDAEMAAEAKAPVMDTIDQKVFVGDDIDDVTPGDTFVNYKLVDGTVDVATPYYNEQMSIHGHPRAWADSLGLEYLSARQFDGFVRILCKAKE